MKRGSIHTVCDRVEEESNDEKRVMWWREKLLIEAPVNGGRNYNGPKVAKFLVG